MRTLTIALAATLTVACSDAGLAVDPPPEGSYRAIWGPLTVAPGVEDVRCVDVALGNAGPIQIHAIHNTLSAASHHFIVYKAPADAEEDLEPRPCDSVENLVDPSTGVPLMITQKSEEVLALPDGVAFELGADQVVRLELHYINASDAPVDMHAVATFTPIEDGAFEHAADFLFVGSPDISIPPMQSATLGPVYLPMPPELLGAQVFGVTGHQHQWGTDVYVEAAESQGGPAASVYDVEAFDWDEPETVYHDPPFAIPDGGGFNLQCEWFNGSADTVEFGEGVDDEMCFFWAYYFPSVGARTCFHTDMFGDPIDVCCPSERDADICALIGSFF